MQNVKSVTISLRDIRYQVLLLDICWYGRHTGNYIAAEVPLSPQSARRSGSEGFPPILRRALRKRSAPPSRSLCIFRLARPGDAPQRHYPHLVVTTRQATPEGVPPSTDAGPAGDVEQTESAQRVFSFSILVSAIRCTLTYVVFPFLLPFVGLADFGPYIGVVVAVVAIVSNVISIRRMHRAQHPWRVPVTIINVAMIGLVTALLIDDIATLVS